MVNYAPASVGAAIKRSRCADLRRNTLLMLQENPGKVLRSDPAETSEPSMRVFPRFEPRAAWRLLALSLNFLALFGCGGKAQVAPPPPPEVSVMQVKVAPITVYDEYVAQTQAPDTIEIRSQVTGLLEQQAFADGARVRKGALLYVIDQRPFEAQLAQARATVAQAEANLINAQQSLARTARLIAQKAVSQQDYDAAVAQEKASTALVDAQKALLRDA